MGSKEQAAYKRYVARMGKIYARMPDPVSMCWTLVSQDVYRTGPYGATNRRQAFEELGYPKKQPKKQPRKVAA